MKPHPQPNLTLNAVYSPEDHTVSVRFSCEWIEDAQKGVLGPEAKGLADKLAKFVPEVPHVEPKPHEQLVMGFGSSIETP